MGNDKIKNLLQSWNQVKDQLQDCLEDKKIKEKKKKILNFVEKAKEELSDVIEHDVQPLLEEGKKEIDKIQKKLGKLVIEKEKAKTKPKVKSKKKSNQ